MIDDRPIKPDRKYLEQYIEKISKVEKKDFLKRKSQSVLPCYNHQNEKKQIPDRKNENIKSKAEIYEQIKEKNRRRFGQKKIEFQQQPEAKKIDPKKMTVNYKPRHNQPKIDTNQYKLKKDKPQQTRPKQNTQKQEKVEYDKLLDYFQKQLSQFEKEKEQFNKVANKLKFKQAISQEPGLQYSKIRRQVECNLISQKLSVTYSELDKSLQKDHQSEGQPSKLKTVRECTKHNTKDTGKPLSKTFSIDEIRNCIDQTSEQLQRVKEKMLNRQLFLQEHRYDIFQIYLLPQFDPQTIYDYIDHRKLKHDGNELYNKAIQAFNSKFERKNQENHNIMNEEEQNSMKKQIKVRFIDQKRVMKYEGWTEVWIPGKQRLMANQQGYKVIWLKNGDVLQQFPNSIKSYFCKVKDIVKIQYKNEPSVYYHYPTHQLWRILQNNVRQTVFQNGVHSTSNQQNQEDDDF